MGEVKKRVSGAFSIRLRIMSEWEVGRTLVGKDGCMATDWELLERYLGAGGGGVWGVGGALCGDGVWGGAADVGWAGGGGGGCDAGGFYFIGGEGGKDFEKETIGGLVVSCDGILLCECAEG